MRSKLKLILSGIFIAICVCLAPSNISANPTSGITTKVYSCFKTNSINQVPISGIVKSVYQYRKQCQEEPIKLTKIKKMRAKPKSLEKQRKPSGAVMDVPPNNSFKSFMDADCIKGASMQKALKSKYVLSDNGVWTVDGRYCIAVGSYYTQEIGTYIDVVMENGNVIECILAECKANEDTDELNMQCKDSSVVEFVVNQSSLASLVMQTGDCSYVDQQWQGEIKSIIVYKTVAK